MRYCLTLRSASIAAAVMLAVTIGKGARAQTLPSSQPPSRSPPAAKPRASANVKSCSEYGAGFVNIPGTGACIKIGGAATVEGGISRGR